MKMLPEDIEVMISVIIIIFAVLNGIIRLLSRSPIDRFLSTRQDQVKQGVRETGFGSFLFLMVIVMILVTDTEFHASKEFVLASLYVGVILFLILLLVSVITSWIRSEVPWFQSVIQATTYITYFGSVIPAVLFADFVDYNTINNRTILFMLIFLWILYTIILSLVYYIIGDLWPKRSGYRIQLMESSMIDELYIVTALDKERLILAEDEKDKKNQFFTPFYIYNYTNKTLHMVERADRTSTEIPRKDLYSKRQR